MVSMNQSVLCDIAIQIFLVEHDPNEEVPNSAVEFLFSFLLNFHIDSIYRFISVERYEFKPHLKYVLGASEEEIEDLLKCETIDDLQQHVDSLLN